MIPLTLQHRAERLHANQSLPARLMAVTHFVQKQTMDRLGQTRRYGKLSLAFAPYVIVLIGGDCSPGELAERLSISKQSCSKIVGELERLKLIRRRTNSQDSRSSILSLSSKGIQLIRDGVDFSNEIQDRLAEAIGDQRLRRLLIVLDTLGATMDIERFHRAPPIEDAVAKIAGSRPTRLATLLPGLSFSLRRRLMASLDPGRVSELPANIGPYLGLICEGGARLQYIANILGVSKQTAAATTAELAQLGYACRAQDPHDRRQVIVSLSPRGEKLLLEIVAGVDKVEEDIRNALSRPDYQLLDETMTIFYESMTMHLDSAGALRSRIQQLSRQLVDELGVTGARSLAQLVMMMTRGKP